MKQRRYKDIVYILARLRLADEVEEELRVFVKAAKSINPLMEMCESLS